MSGVSRWGYVMRGLIRGGWVVFLAVCGAFCLSDVAADGPLPGQATDETPAVATEWRSLFDGETLAGFDFDPRYWSVRDGRIVGEIPAGQTLDHNTWLVYQERPFGDFELRFQFKLSGLPAANSGVQFRSQVESIRQVNGYQADLDMGATWLGRIYDEHGRALLVERGTRVAIDTAGQRRVQTLAPAKEYAVLFREREWNDYRIVAIGPRVAVWINGTFFCELWHEEEGEADRSGRLAWQLHSGPETLLQLRALQVQELSAEDSRLGAWLAPTTATAAEAAEAVTVGGDVPRGLDERPLNLGFEAGTLADWTATGDAFRGQPVARDGISQRWPEQKSGKVGEYFVAGYEVVGDKGVGTLTSAPFVATQPFVSFLVGGGRAPATRVELQQLKAEGQWETFFTAGGREREAMDRAVVDLQTRQGQTLRVQLVDESRGGWGHLNFDDFRLHAERPVVESASAVWRSTANPLLQHLVPNPVKASTLDPAADATLQSMFVPTGFSVQTVVAEPRVHQPMAFTFDGRGRLWVVEGHCYPEKRPNGQGIDRILVFANEDGDGSFESRTVFYEGLNLVSALEVGHGGVWVGAAPELLFIPDADGDLVPDGPPQVLLDGFGYADTHETLNNFCWGPDGWLYGNQGVFNQSRIGAPGCPAEERRYLAAGVFRYHPVRHVFEVFAHGGSNQWGLDFDQHGQLFMTHCRSYWGGGPTTHVLPGGHYWNQVNSGYADFVSPQGLDIQPGLKHYLMASARYGHGEGGAGKAGSRQVYGGHSHVGTMLYLGDNWPAEYQNRLFTHNLHGHQINQQINLREHGGYDTVHAGYDVFFCSDPQYIGVDLKYGPEGAVYISDWYDPRHCHNPNVEQWDRGNGRIYRLQYDATYRPVTVDFPGAAEDALLAALRHANEWHVRMAMQELGRRARRDTLSSATREAVLARWSSESEARQRLRYLWCLAQMGELTSQRLVGAWSDPDEYVRGWAVRLAVDESPEREVGKVALPSNLWQPLWQMAQVEKSLLVKRELASASDRLVPEQSWQLIRVLAGQAENAVDGPLVSLLWFAVAGGMQSDVAAGLRLGDETVLPVLRDSIEWYAAKRSELGRERLITRLGLSPPEERYRSLRLLQHAVQGLRGVSLPDTWRLVAEDLYQSADAKTREAAAAIGAVFRDPILFAQHWRTVELETSGPAVVAALQVLQQDSATDKLDLLLKLLERPELVRATLPLLRRYESPAAAATLLTHMPQWEEGSATAAMELLTSRTTWALALLDAVDEGRVDAGVVTAYHVRQMVGLGDSGLTQRLETSWGQAGQTSAERAEQIHRLVQLYEGAPLWAYDGGAGKQHFERLCVNCHQASAAGANLGPLLAGSGSKGIAYLVENIVDPDAVVGRDFQARLILTTEGRVVTGLVIDESPSAITIRTATDAETIAKEEIEEIRISEQSFMPAGLLDSLEERETIELFKYLLDL